MPQFFLKDLTGHTHQVNVNNNTKVSDVLRKLRNKGVDVNTLILRGEAINGNTLMRNTNYMKLATGHVIKKSRGNANARPNARGARPNAGRPRANAGRRQQNHNVNRVRSLLSSGYINTLKRLKVEGQADEAIKRYANETLQRMVDKYLISALNKM